MAAIEAQKQAVVQLQIAQAQLKQEQSAALKPYIVAYDAAIAAY